MRAPSFEMTITRRERSAVQSFPALNRNSLADTDHSNQAPAPKSQDVLARLRARADPRSGPRCSSGTTKAANISGTAER